MGTAPSSLIFRASPSKAAWHACNRQTEIFRPLGTLTNSWRPSCRPYHLKTYILNTGWSRGFHRLRGMYAKRLPYRDIECPDRRKPKQHAQHPAITSGLLWFWPPTHQYGAAIPNPHRFLQPSETHPLRELSYLSFDQIQMRRPRYPNRYHRLGIQCYHSPVWRNPKHASHRSPG